MNSSWPETSLGQILKRRKDEIDIQPLQTYKRLTIRMNGNGIVVRDRAIGSEIGTKRQFVVESGQLVLSKIDARNGAFGVLPQECAGAIITGNFWAFDPDAGRVDVRYLNYLTMTPLFVDFCIRASEGTTNRRYLQESKFLVQKVPLPPLDEQRRIVSRIEQLAANVAKARSIRQETAEEAESLVASALSHFFDFSPGDALPKEWRWLSFRAVLADNKDGMTTGPFGTLLQKTDIREDGVPILGIKNVQANRFVPGFTDHISQNKAEELAVYKLRQGDIVVARSGTVGRSCVVPEGLTPQPIMSTNLIRLRVNSEVFLPTLLCMLFNGSTVIERHKELLCRGSTRTFFTQKILFRLELPVPPIAEQRRIMEELRRLESVVDQLKRSQSETSAELDALMPSILDKAFRGEL